MIDALKNRIAGLTNEQRVDLLVYLRDLVEGKNTRTPVEVLAAERKELLSTITGRPISQKSRDPLQFLSRALVCWSLLRDGASLKEAGKAVGKSHCEAIYMRDRINDVTDHPDIYKKEYEILTKFKKAIYGTN